MTDMYSEEIRSRLKDDEKWPSFDRPYFLEELNEVADQAYAKHTIEGHLAALLIYHQLLEEMVRVLLDCSNFHIQCSIYPQRIKPPVIDKGTMFGSLLQQLRQGVMTDETEQFIGKCNEMNSIRTRMVHRITRKASVSTIQRQTTRVKKLFDEAWTLFDYIYAEYRATFADHRDNIFDTFE